MKKHIFYLTLIICVNTIIGQSEEVKKFFEPTETDSLFIEAIENYIEQLKHNKPNTIYVQYENYLTRIPNTINEFKIVQLGLANRKDYFRKNKNHLTLVVVSPLTLENGFFHITLTPYAARLKGKRKNGFVF